MKKKLKVLFNASVVLAGLYSPSGASGTLLTWVKKGMISGGISELIFEEAVRHAAKVGREQWQVEKELINIFRGIANPPGEYMVKKYYGKVTDRGDAHVLASYDEEKCETLVTLDKKHLLVIQGKIKGIRIMSPGQLVRRLRRMGRAEI